MRAAVPTLFQVKVVRYAQALRLLRGLPETASILEVGPGASGLGTWWDRGFVGVDVAFDGSPVPQMRPVVGDAAALPFGDDRFDLVVCVDMLQEVPTDLLEAVCSELARVTRGAAVIVAASGAEAEASDRRVLEWCRRRRVTPPVWLPRQVREGLPSTEAIRSTLLGHGRLTEGSNRSCAWQELVVRAEAHPGLRSLRAVAGPFLRFLGRRAPRRPGGGEPSYARWFILELKPGRSAR
jgi:SAM-dependent methyltransferase